MEPFLGQIQAFGFNFAPRGWAKCNGQLLPIAQYSALFSLLGTIYGGDGRTTFALPDLRGRVMVHEGSGAGLTNKQLGQRGGSETNTLTVSQLPSHNHTLMAAFDAGTTPAPAGNLIGDAGFFDNEFLAVDPTNPATMVDMHANSIANTGANQSINNIQPYLTINICIALEGLFPSRS